MSYWDSSALVKLYVNEADSAVFEHFAITSSSTPITSRLALYEVQTVLRRKESEGAIIAGTAEASCLRLAEDARDGHVRIIELTPAIEREFSIVLARCFEQMPPLWLRTLDAVHLASALAAGESEMVLTDKRLREAALSLGFKVFP